MPLWIIANWKLIVGAGLAILLAVASSWVTAKIYGAKISDLKAAQATARAEAFKTGQAMQRDADVPAIELAGHQGIVQEKIVTKYKTIEKEISIYVKDDSTCITFGLLRVHDAAAYGVDPTTLALAAGQSDDTCAGIGWRRLAEAFTSNYGTAEQNAAELTDPQALAVRYKAVTDKYRTGR